MVGAWILLVIGAAIFAGVILYSAGVFHRRWLADRRRRPR
jgi:hypothetical protein